MEQYDAGSVAGSGVHKGGGSMMGQSSHPTQGANQLRQGLNPMLRGYSPSKHRWKIATATGTATGTNRQNNSNHGHGHQHHGAAAASMSHGHSAGSHFGGANPNVYTRSTKHTPAHAAKV